MKVQADNGGDRARSGGDSTSTSLLERVKSQDPAAWQRLVDLYSPLVYSWCRRCGLTPEDASDVLQDVFCAVSSHIAQFRRDRQGDTFRGWVRIIARNKIRDHFRRTGREPEAVGGSTAQGRFLDLAEDEPDLSSFSGHDAEFGSLLHRALELVRGEFEDRTWQAFWQSAVDGRSAAEIGRELQMTPAAVRQAKYKVLRRLRNELDDP